MKRTAFLLVLLLLTTILASTAPAQDKAQARIERIGDLAATELRVLPTFGTADTCIVRHDLGITWGINGWVVGNELYKSYLDPSLTCPDPYPFTVTEINMPMAFDAATPLTVAVDVELADMTDPSCPFPGEMVTISSDWELQVPGAGLYDIWIPLDTPVVVNGPFLVGFFIGNVIDTAVHAKVTCDTVPVACRSYNIWETTTGYVDLANNEFYNFPGRLVLYASGVPGGGGGPDPDPIPQLTWVSPIEEDQLLFFPSELWVEEATGSSIVDYVVFEYSDGVSWSVIGNDYDGASPTRNGVDPAVAGTGFSIEWNDDFLPDGEYTIRATVYDTLNRSASITRTVTIEATPPVPTIASHTNFDWFCPTLSLLLNCSDEDVSYMDMRARAVGNNYNLNLLTLNQNVLGDTDGNLGDGNPAAEGEFGDYYSGPAAATIALRVWYERGYGSIFQEGVVTMNSIAVAESLAVLFDTRADFGTRDGKLISGLREYIADHGNNMRLDYLRDPDYVELRSWVQDYERSVVLGLGGDPGLWVALNGFTGWASGPDEYTVSISNPLTGQIETVTWRDGVGQAELQIDGTWHPVEMMVSIIADDWTVSRSTVGADFSGDDGWSIAWTPNGLVEGTKFFLMVGATDATNLTGVATLLAEYNCANQYVEGDFDNNGTADVGDLYLLIQFITNDGPPPAGGVGRADCNCDTYINVADVVYLMNYVFGHTTTPPCY